MWGMFHLIIPSFFVLYYTITSFVPSALHRLRSVKKTVTTPTKPRKVPSPDRDSNEAIDDELNLYKSLFHQLHNLELHARVLPQARDVLISFLSNAVDCADQITKSNILDIPTFDAEALASFIRARDDAIGHRWEEYVQRRHSGAQRELFADKEAAIEWLRQRAPVKYVDGAWLGHIHKISTPFHLRSVAKNAWQILSEELGDGDLEKNHAHVYRQLMNDIGANLPDAESIEFISKDLGLNSKPIWEAALAQVIISLFPNNFLPEILGFNLHFELLTWDTMRAIKELRELGLNDYYFRLHISIDNADSGHTAMALKIVLDYMDTIKETEGEERAAEAWRRIQSGFLMSEMFDRPEAKKSTLYRSTGSKLTPIKSEVVRIFKSKAAVSQRLHCASRSNLPWIQAGDSKSSRFIQQISWKGQMFGAFTHVEVELLERWINLLTPQKPSDRYWRFVGAQRKHDLSHSNYRDVFTEYPVFEKNGLLQWPSNLDDTPLEIKVDFGRPVDMDKFLPLWFAQQSLLESFVSVPFRTCNESVSAIIRVLRVQYGFATEENNVAGMDDFVRHDVTDLVDIGLHIMARAGLPKPDSLARVIEGRNADQAETMIELSMRPLEHAQALLGMSAAFIDLHHALASDPNCKLLDDRVSGILRTMATRERLGLRDCRERDSQDPVKDEDFRKGFLWAKLAIEGCFLIITV
ncbi:hypothetical protein D6D01_06601 [Aureobasidium pullulans]|uniref:Heme oxygenase-like protein n=1 Tax=Aureobasidium pullulans TaxID=5580 RepID=A0A4S9L0B1_AURPU|nr:hypothetical protein D6D01_06601 [Aureobasidium pullulans]